MKKIYKSILAASVICLTSCTGLLDMTPTDRVSDKGRKRRIRQKSFNQPG